MGGEGFDKRKEQIAPRWLHQPPDDSPALGVSDFGLRRQMLEEAGRFAVVQQLHERKKLGGVAEVTQSVRESGMPRADGLGLAVLGESFGEPSRFRPRGREPAELLKELVSGFVANEAVVGVGGGSRDSTLPRGIETARGGSGAGRRDG